MFDTLKTKDTNLLIRDLQVIEKEIESMTKSSDSTPIELF